MKFPRNRNRKRKRKMSLSVKFSCPLWKILQCGNGIKFVKLGHPTYPVKEMWTIMCLLIMIIIIHFQRQQPKGFTFRSDFRKQRHRITFTFDIFTFKIVLPGDKAACKIPCFRNIDIRLAILNKMEEQMFIFDMAERGKWKTEHQCQFRGKFHKG